MNPQALQKDAQSSAAPGSLVEEQNDIAHLQVLYSKLMPSSVSSLKYSKPAIQTRGWQRLVLSQACCSTSSVLVFELSDSLAKHASVKQNAWGLRDEVLSL